MRCFRLHSRRGCVPAPALLLLLSKNYRLRANFSNPPSAYRTKRGALRRYWWKCEGILYQICNTFPLQKLSRCGLLSVVCRQASSHNFSYTSTSIILNVPFALLSSLVTPSSNFFPETSSPVTAVLITSLVNSIRNFFPFAGLHIAVK